MAIWESNAHIETVSMKSSVCNKDSVSHNTFFRTILDRYWDSWYPEIAAVTLSLACTTAIYAVLKSYNGSSPPHMAYGLTLNAIISILATTSKASLLYSVSNALGQLKWIWFNDITTKQLSAVAIFEDASRGPLGALQLFAADTRKSLASFGALIVVLALTLEPFVQQIIGFDSNVQYDKSSGAIMNQARIIDIGLFYDVARWSSILTSAVWNFNLEWEPKCTSGNCTWNNHESFVWCSKCTQNRAWHMSEGCSVLLQVDDWRSHGELQYKYDQLSSYIFSQNCTAVSDNNDQITTQIDMSWVVDTTSNETNRMSTNYTVSNLVFLNSEFDHYLRSLTKDPSSAENQLSSFNTTPSLMKFAYMRWTVQPDMSLAANSVDCSLDLCTQKSNLIMRNGKMDIEVLSRSPTRKIYYEHNIKRNSQICFSPENNSSIDITQMQLEMCSDELGHEKFPCYLATGKELTFCQSAFVDVGSEAVKVLPSSDITGMEVTWRSMELYSQSYNRTGAVEFLTKPTQEIANRGYEIPKYWNFFPSGSGTNSSTTFSHIQLVGFEQVMKNLASALTKATLDATLNINGTAEIEGQLGSTGFLVRVRWVWFALPAALCGGGILFLALTILFTWRTKTPLWKTSTNALLYHGINHEVQTTDQLDTISRMDRQAQATRARLTPIDIRERRLLETVVTRRNAWAMQRLK